MIGTSALPEGTIAGPCVTRSVRRSGSTIELGVCGPRRRRAKLMERTWRVVLVAVTVVGVGIGPAGLSNAALGPKLASPCIAAVWGRTLGPYVCVRVGGVRYLHARVPLTLPLVPLSGTPPKVGARCTAKQWGRIFERFICVQTAPCAT